MVNKPQFENLDFVMNFSNLSWGKMTQLHEWGWEERDFISVVHDFINCHDYIPIFYFTPECFLLHSLEPVHNWTEKSFHNNLSAHIADLFCIVTDPT